MLNPPTRKRSLFSLKVILTVLYWATVQRFVHNVGFHRPLSITQRVVCSLQLLCLSSQPLFQASLLLQESGQRGHSLSWCRLLWCRPPRVPSSTGLRSNALSTTSASVSTASHVRCSIVLWASLNEWCAPSSSSSPESTKARTSAGLRPMSVSLPPSINPRSEPQAVTGTIDTRKKGMGNTQHFRWMRRVAKKGRVMSKKGCVHSKCQ